LLFDVTQRARPPLSGRRWFAVRPGRWKRHKLLLKVYQLLGSDLDSVCLRLFGFRHEDMLSEHFAEEERGGYLKSALTVAPEFSAQAAKLRPQHTQFLERLDHLITRLHESETSWTYWRTSRDDVEAIITDLREHEQCENAIVQSAFEQDRGTND
jgi:hypothetical protein